MKPHEETLDVETIGDGGRWMVTARSVIDPPDCSRLLGQAPAMARLLLSLQHVDTSDGEYAERCPCCLNKTYGHTEPGMVGIPVDIHPGKHADDCALVAVLRAAGVVE